MKTALWFFLLCGITRMSGAVEWVLRGQPLLKHVLASINPPTSGSRMSKSCFVPLKWILSVPISARIEK